jgi:hypothetical protein
MAQKLFNTAGIYISAVHNSSGIVLRFRLPLPARDEGELWEFLSGEAGNRGI